jgi:L-ascorbate metabolism protein UlaG (beta-lactamase superfamily)
VYVTGDTEYDRKLIEVKIYKPDIMIICINGDGNNGNMNIEEAIKLTALIRPKIVIPMHYGMFKENTADPQKFTRLLKKCNLTSRGVILDYAKPFIYKSSLASNQ